MNCYEFTTDGDAFALKRVSRPEPRPAPGRVIVRVRAASLNYRDLIQLRNKAGRKVGGKIPLSDGAGEVVAVGEDVAGVAVGDRVAGCFFQTWQGGAFEMRHHKNDLGGTLDGMLTEYADLAANGVVAIPPSYSWEEAACLPCAGLTAWQALVSRGELRAGQTVLVLGTGGVSIFGIQLAVAHGATAIVTSSRDEKLARAAALGAADGVNYTRNPDWDKEVLRLTGGKGVDRILEVGGGGTLGKSLASVAAGGHVALIGVLTGFGPPADSLFPLVAKNATMDGIYVGSREQFASMNAFLERHAIRPVIDRNYDFAQAAEAFAYLESGEHFGKVVIRV